MFVFLIYTVSLFVFVVSLVRTNGLNPEDCVEKSKLASANKSFSEISLERSLTEYLKITPSEKRILDKAKFKSGVACQTTDDLIKNSKDWSSYYSTALEKADKNLTKLQAKLRESLRADEQLIRSTNPNSLIKPKHPCTGPSLDNDDDNNNPTKFSMHDMISALNSPLNNRDDLKSKSNILEKRLNLSRLNKTDEFFSSPMIIQPKKSDNFDQNNCPQVGISPSEGRMLNVSTERLFGDEQNDHLKLTGRSVLKNETFDVGSELMKAPLDRSDNFNVSANSEITNSFHLNSKSPSILRSNVFPDCINLLVEERSRLQRKILRTKVSLINPNRSI